MSTVTRSTFYERHNNGGVMWPAVPALSIMMVLDTVGIISNTAVVFVTLQSKRLRNTTNHLICLSSFFDSIHVLIHFYLAYVIYSGKNFDTLETCLHKATISLIGLNMGVGLVVMTSFDRLFSVLFPRVHARMNKVLYMGGILAICAAYTIYIITISYTNITDKKDVKVVCLIVEAMHGNPATIWAASACGSTLVAVINYAIVGICIKYKIGNSDTTQRLFKSLSIMTTMMMCSWFLTCASMVIVVALGGTEEQMFYISLYAGITINIACGANFFVLFKFSSEYRNSFKSTAAKWGLISIMPSRVSPSYIGSKSQAQTTNKTVLVKTSPKKGKS